MVDGSEPDPYEESFEQPDGEIPEPAPATETPLEEHNASTEAEPSPGALEASRSSNEDSAGAGDAASTRQSSAPSAEHSHGTQPAVMETPAEPMHTAHGATATGSSGQTASAPAQPASTTILQQVAGQPSKTFPQEPAAAGPGSARSQGSHTGSQQPAAASQQGAGSTVGDEYDDDFQQHQDEPAEGSEPPKPGQNVPSYMHPTAVLPKQPLQEFKNADHEAVMLAFSTGTLMGIRSLPNALQPDFRARLYDAITTAAERERETRRQQQEGEDPRDASGTARMAYGLTTSQPPLQLASGQKGVTRVHPYAGSFTTFEYMPSEYERPRLVQKFERLKGKLAQVAPADFVVKAPPAAPRGAPAFCEYDYAPDPYTSASKVRQVEDYMGRVGALAGPFVTGGRVAQTTVLRGRADECMMQLCRQLSMDWPTAFLQVFEDRSGAVVVSFDRGRALAEGDLPAYMQNMIKSSAIVADFSLVKDGTQWGLVDGDTQSVFYLMWPPWVRHRYVGPLPSNLSGGALQGSSADNSGAEDDAAGSGYAGSSAAQDEATRQGLAAAQQQGVARSESSNKRQEIIATDFAKMGALSRSAASVKPGGLAAGAGAAGSGVAAGRATVPAH